jgi:tripartite-type tricarboxylate transporter receptor subunit TctC
MSLTRRALSLCLASIAATALAFVPLAYAQSYPDRPIRLIVGYQPGSATDALARITASLLGEKLGQPILVDNRPGAGGLIGVEEERRAKPDGYTLLWVNNGEFTITPNLQTVSFDPLKDFTPLARMVNLPSVYVINSAVPATNMKELISLAQKKPGAIRWGSPGIGSGAYLQGEMLRTRAGIDISHVAYKGGNEVLAAVLRGEIELGIQALGSVAKRAEEGKLRILATTGRSRLSGAPDVPTMIECGYPDFVTTAWWGIVAPASLPKTIGDRLVAELMAVGRSAQFRERVAAYGAPADDPLPGAKFADFISQELKESRQIIDSLGLKTEN